MDPTEPTLRRARDTDSAGVVELIARVYREYPNCVLDVDREEPELRAPSSRFERFWVLEASGVIVGCVGCATRATAEGSIVELKKLYLDSDLRGRGLGRTLVETVEAHARDRSAREIELWTDTRFETAHLVYERLGYGRTGRERELHDLSATRESHFSKTLSDEVG